MLINKMDEIAEDDDDAEVAVAKKKWKKDDPDVRVIVINILPLGVHYTALLNLFLS